MKYNIAINGFGRIGRLTLRAYLERKITNFNIVAINDLGNTDSNLHLLKYDSVHGRLNNELNKNGQEVEIDKNKIHFLSEPDPEKLPLPLNQTFPFLPLPFFCFFAIIQVGLENS